MFISGCKKLVRAKVVRKLGLGFGSVVAAAYRLLF